MELNGVKYNVEVNGKGFPLILLHGFTGDGSTWKPFLTSFNSASKMIIVDLVGHGQTESPDDYSMYSVMKVAADLNSLLNKLGIEKTDLLGYSMGGRLAIAFAALYPHKVRKLVLESTTPGLKTEKERQLRRKQDGALAEKLLTGGVEAFVDYWERLPLFQTQMNLPAKVRASIRKRRLQNNPFGLANSLLGMGTGAQPSWWESISHFSCETLILAGEFDRKFCQIAEEMENRIPNAESFQIKGCGHAIHVEEPEKFGTIVSRFLSK
ncbi:2-succinyl-6-hydroxy-2,4-cyclohexadiene-1-carboxylate synthase [Bacillus sp. B15-48]|nr:2-succinyl-6-hydroxy-2,4-cyclohexadiene-1-carboxylate synthase [Bacillus sp. B15-48]